MGRQTTWLPDASRLRRSDSWEWGEQIKHNTASFHEPVKRLDN